MSDFEIEPTPEAPQVPAADAPAAAALTRQAMEYLSQTQPWVRFISVFIFLSAGFMAMAGLAMMAMMMAGGMAGRGLGRGLGAFGGLALGSFYLMMACIYIAPGVFLHRYAVTIKRLKASCTADVLEDALKHQRSFWRFVGIVGVIGLVVSFLVIVFAIAVGVLGAIMMGRR